MNEVTVKEQAPLDELMLAMDVVDTLRHQELVLARELEADDRDAQQHAPPREIYTAQGIEVTDAVLEQGVRAQMQASALMDEPAFVRKVEAAYREMFSRWAAGSA